MLQELQLPRQQSLGLIYYPYCWTTLHPQNLPHPGTAVHVSVISNIKLTPNPLHDPRPWFHYMSIHIHALEEKHHLSHYAFSLSSTSWAYFKDACDRRSGLTGPHQSSESTNLQLWFSLFQHYALHERWARDTQKFMASLTTREYIYQGKITEI